MEELVEAINNMNNTLLYMANQLQGIQSTLDDIKGIGLYPELFIDIVNSKKMLDFYAISYFFS